jgi:ATP-dependent helicase YprA (DUF1998 family)
MAPQTAQQRARHKQSRQTNKRHKTAKKNRIASAPVIDVSALKISAGMAPDPPPSSDSHKPMLERRRQQALSNPDAFPNWTPDTTHLMNSAFKRLTSHDLRPFQIDSAESLALGMDCVVCAPTGSGKTMAPILNFFAHPDRYQMILIISPLKELQQDQVNRPGAVVGHV